MSRTIDPAVEVEDLTDEEVEYLWAREDKRVTVEEMRRRGLEPYGVQHPDRVNRETAAQYLASMPDFGTANTAGRTEVPDPLTEDQLKPRKVNLTKPQLRGVDDEDDVEDEDEDEEMDYSTMTNDELRAELSSRGLSVAGTKADMITRLEENDEEEDEE